MDILSLQLQISELREMLLKTESEKGEIHAQVLIKSRVSETLENLPTELNALSVKYPQSSPSIPPDSQGIETVNSENLSIDCTNGIHSSNEEKVKYLHETKTTIERDTFSQSVPSMILEEEVSTVKGSPNPTSSSSLPPQHITPKPKPKLRLKPQPQPQDIQPAKLQPKPRCIKLQKQLPKPQPQLPSKDEMTNHGMQPSVSLHVDTEDDLTSPNPTPSSSPPPHPITLKPKPKPRLKPQPQPQVIQKPEPEPKSRCIQLPKQIPKPQPQLPVKNEMTNHGSQPSVALHVDTEDILASHNPQNPHKEQQQNVQEVTREKELETDCSGQCLTSSTIAPAIGNVCSDHLHKTTVTNERLLIEPSFNSSETVRSEKDSSQQQQLVLKPQITSERSLATEMSVTSPELDIPSVSYGLPIIIDNGSSNIRAGFTEDKAPRSVFPTVISTYSSRSRQLFFGVEVQKRGGSIAPKHPVQRGIITNWDLMEKLWNYTFHTALKADPTEHYVFLIESAGLSDRQKMVEIMFEKFQVPATYVANSGPLSLTASGKETGVTVSIGDGVCSVTPLYQKGAIPATVVKLGGSDLTNYLGKLLAKEGHRFVSSGPKHTLCEIKETICYVTTNPQGLNDTQKVYTLPNGTTLSSKNSCSYLCPESLFQPSTLDVDFLGIHKVTHEAIMGCDSCFRKKLFSNIILSGGSTMFPGFAMRLQNEIAALVPPSVKVKVLAPIERKNLAWTGGAIVASLDVFSNKWICKQEYEETGAFIVNSRCMDSFLYS